jgi:multidrug efflux pump subunit AcrB
MITPMIAAYFLKPHGHAEHGGGPMMDRYLKVLLWSLGRARPGAAARVLAMRGTGLARRLRARMRDHRMWMIGIALLALVLTVVLFVAMPSEMFPTRTAISPRSASKWSPAPPSPRPRRGRRWPR